MVDHDGIMGNERNNDGQNDDVVDDGIPKDFTSPNVRVNAGKTGKWRYSTSKGTQNQNSRPAPIRGNKTGASGLKMAEQYDWLFVSGLSTDTTPKDIIKFVQDSGKDGCTCEKIKQGRKGSRAAFALVCHGEKKYHKDAGFWSAGTTVNSFLNLRSLVLQSK
ncbi:hypothetical protein HHI36_008198 [Cryptolaemus montrouzieri]|uniref:RRM domain-containing protein n=1 Tax=Cryptolaemus montrouzieri TaxID=559131 RepID=A0ABD2MS22_9CUCU